MHVFYKKHFCFLDFILNSEEVITREIGMLRSLILMTVPKLIIQKISKSLKVSYKKHVYHFGGFSNVPFIPFLYNMLVFGQIIF